MKIVINGKEADMPEGATFVDVLAQKQLTAASIIVEYNGKIVPKDEWEKIILQSNDTLEILTFVGGG